MDARSLATLQGTYYAASGLWPLLHMRSFLAVTGPKKDLWLVRTVGLLVTCIGGQLLLSAKRNQVGPESKVLGAASAASLTAIDLYYAANGTISPIYLLDAAAEAALVGLWTTVPPDGAPRIPDV